MYVGLFLFVYYGNFVQIDYNCSVMKLRALILFFCFIPFGARALNNRMPARLADFSSSSVYSVCQDRLGAMWINSSRGLYRYNGHAVEYLHSPLPNHMLVSSGGEYIYAPSSHSLIRFCASSSESVTYSFPGEFFDNSVLLADADSLLAVVRNTVYLARGDSLVKRQVFSPEISITTLLHLPGGSILAGTQSSGIYIWSADGIECVLPLSTPVEALHLTRDGRLFAGLLQGGLLQLDPSSFRILRRYESVGGVPLKSVRSLDSDSSGTLYCGAVNGLFILSLDGVIAEEPIDNSSGRPVCSVYLDRDGNLWTGTYYSGLFYGNVTSFPFVSIDLPDDIKLIRGLYEDKRGGVWILTDNYGMWHSSSHSGPWSKVPGTDGIKFQGGWYDPVADEIWTGDYMAPLLCYEIRTGRFRRYPVSDPQNAGRPESIVSVCPFGGELYLGGYYGVYAFNPKKESVITRKLPGLESRVHDLVADGDGNLWIASQGLYRFDPAGGFVRPVPRPEGAWHWELLLVSNLSLDARGRLWIAFVGGEEGVGCLSDGHITMYSSSSCGLADNHTAYVVPLDGRFVLVGTVAGLSIIDTVEGICHNYSSGNGLGFRSARGGATLSLSDGSLLAGGGNGLVRLPAGFDLGAKLPFSVTVDAVYVNGERFDRDVHAPFLGEMEQDHTQTNFSFDVASYDYTGVIATEYSCMLEGFDNDWRVFDVNTPVVYMNMDPGHYVFRVKAGRGGGQTVSSSLRLTVRPVWYRTVLARSLFILMVLVIVFFILYTVWSRMILAERLELRERENEERTRFFVDLSYRMRTPLNLIIGQIERFFRDFGSRTAGVENIEDVYSKAKQMRTLISEFVDEQNDALEQEAPDERTATAVKDAKFLNAAIGAVERNLYSADLDIPLLCSELSVGKTTLTARLKAACGQTPRQFIEDIRLKHAASMLSDGTYRISEISDRLGFSSPKYFAIRFRKKYGCVPSGYKPS